MFIKKYILTLSGVVAQLVEHLLCKQRVTGSNPVGSTKVDSRYGKSISLGS